MYCCISTVIIIALYPITHHKRVVVSMFQTYDFDGICCPAIVIDGNQLRVVFRHILLGNNHKLYQT